MSSEQIDAVAAIIDPPAWSGRTKRSDEHRRRSSQKRARAILVHLGVIQLAEHETVKVSYYRLGQCRNNPNATTHTYAQMEDGSLFPMCGYGWNRSDGQRFSIFRGYPGSQGDCLVCIKNVAAGAPPVFDGFPHKTRWL